MQVCVFIEPHHGASYDTQLRLAQHAEACGFHGLFRADHYQAMGRGDGLPGPTDAWLSLAGLARETSRIRLGTLVSSATFRDPGPLAISVAQVDLMSSGRVELGIGAGWYQREHTSYGIRFPPAGARFDRLAEQLQIITGLWATPLGGRYNFRGTHYELIGAPALPKPLQTPRPPIIVGGRGRRRTPHLAAVYADEYNAAFLPPDEARQAFRRVADAALLTGRGGWPLRLSGGITVACGRTPSEVHRRAAALARLLPPPASPVVGTPQQLVDRIGAYAEVGVGRVYLRLADLADIDHLRLLGEQVLPAVAEMATPVNPWKERPCRV